MKAHLLILQRVGTTLIILGVVEIYLAVWKFICEAPSSPDIYRLMLLPFLFIALAWGGLFFIAPGILLFRGGLRTSKYVRYLALFGLASYAISFLLEPFVQSLGYQLLLLRLMPETLALGMWQALVYLAFGFWLQYLLGQSEIMNAQVDARITPAPTLPPI
jgi:hypothetical protein